MQADSARARSVRETRGRILDVALEVLGRSPDASMADIAAAAGVVRRTVYGHFPTRAELIVAFAQRAAEELGAVLAEVDTAEKPADQVWVDFVGRLWPLADRYRVLLVLRRSEYGEQIHGLLGPPETMLANLVARGQDSGAFGRHLPADVLGRLAQSSVFSIADTDVARGTLGPRAAAMTSLLMLGVPAARAESLLSSHS